MGRMVKTDPGFTPGTQQYASKLARMEDCVRILLAGIGENTEREGLLDTPKVRTGMEMLTGPFTRGDTLHTRLPGCRLTAARCQGIHGRYRGLPAVCFHVCGLCRGRAAAMQAPSTLTA
jgi:hypothetical protein